MASLKYYFYALRPQQWIKNFFVLLPLVFSKELNEISAVIRSITAFICFCGASSSVYLLNDIIDLEKDKLHPLKKIRPLASGRVLKRVILLIAFFLALSSLSISFHLRLAFGLVIFFYLTSNILYSYLFKQMVIVDVMSIGFFFILRVLAGAIVLNVEISHWLLICTGVLALFIGFNKRRHELTLLRKDASGHRDVLERYSPYFIDQITAVLTASTVIFYTLYTVDSVTIARFGTKSLLLTVPFVYYGIFRYLYLVHRRKKGGDPSRIVLSDNKMIINLILWLVVAVGVIYFQI